MVRVIYLNQTFLVFDCENLVSLLLKLLPFVFRRYSLIPTGGGPGVTVGHTCTYLPGSENGSKGKILIVGGANPNGSFSESHVINLGN